MMKSNERKVLGLESELIRLSNLVRERRSQLARLRDCPNPLCPCRAVWRDQVEKKLSGQMHKVSKTVRQTPTPRGRVAASKGNGTARAKAKG